MAKLSDRLKARQAELQPLASQASESLLPFEQITDRPNGDTRPLNPDHVKALVESIKAVGLIQPLAVDNQARILAGGHRKAAIALLKESNPDVYAQWFSNGVPVRQYDFDALLDPDRALTIEVSENEKRQDYTPSEVRKLADRLKQAGYEDLAGRPSKGQKSVVLALSTIIGKSDKTVRRYLSEDQPPKGGHLSTFSNGFSVERTARQVEKWLKQDEIPPRVAAQLEKLKKELGRVLKLQPQDDRG
jgi:ParB family transcriptional regulator, chromosome partitioning protein